jgi:3-hydroxymyristoyl/3-hydroxydecanoyl-(acyl carrier protein) dehydratase
MDGHFRAFSLVDRITQLQAGKRAEGKFSVPAHLSRFSSCLAAEAAGQLAAWIAMAQLDFELRPVAGVAADLHFGADVRPGQTLDLAIEIDSCDRDTVNYSAHAYADGVRIIELERSAGPMLPMEAFDAPDAMRRRYELLCGPGAPAGEFPGVAEHEIEIIEEVHAKSSRAFLKVPHEAPFFSDHFPRRPVFPGTMLLDAHIQLGAHCGRAFGLLAAWRPRHSDSGAESEAARFHCSRRYRRAVRRSGAARRQRRNDGANQGIHEWEASRDGQPANGRNGGDR